MAEEASCCMFGNAMCAHMLSHPKDSEGSWSGAEPLPLPQGISQAENPATEALVLVKGKV